MKRSKLYELILHPKVLSESEISKKKRGELPTINNIRLVLTLFCPRKDRYFENNARNELIRDFEMCKDPKYSIYITTPEIAYKRILSLYPEASEYKNWYDMLYTVTYGKFDGITYREDDAK